MNRHNIFYQVHKGLREMLYNTASRLQQTDFTNLEEASVTLEQTKEVLFLFHKHAYTEEHFILPVIKKYKPSAATFIEEKHLQDLELRQRISSLLHIFNSCTVEQEQAIAAGAIRCAFNEFMIVNLQQIVSAEAKLNGLLYKYCTDHELKSISLQMADQLSPTEMNRINTWILRALNNTEITAWLKEIKDSAPDITFNHLIELAEKTLPVNRWMQVQENMTEGAMIA